MKYSIGYQLPDEYDSTFELCQSYREHISSVYFSFAGEPSGRMPLCSSDEENVKRTGANQIEELKAIKDMGISLTLLLNANCYGEKAVSSELLNKTTALVGMLKKETDISSVTTTSPFIAKIIKREFGNSVKTTASVNMRIGTIAAMEQLSAYFDGFYIKKELNRDLESVKELKKWCDAGGKELKILANSGCITDCAFQTFHDNLVAHHKYMQETKEERFPSFCWEYLNSQSKNAALSKILASNWVRPEDVANYEPYFSEMKLATRMHSSPRRVISAYIRQKFSGNIMDLTEPSYSSLLRGVVLDNTRFPEDWFEKTNGCKKRCNECSYCASVADIIKCSF